MKQNKLIELLEKKNENDVLDKETLPHCNNLLYQLKKGVDETVYTDLVQKYLEIRNVKLIIDPNKSEEENLKDFIIEIIEKTNVYYFFVLKNSKLRHQSDFNSSIIPEILCKIFKSILIENDSDLSISAQRDLTIECTYDLENNNIAIFKNKKVDVAVFKDFTFSLGEITKTDFPIPLYAIECKTNLDKNMLAGIRFSSQELKKTFPKSKYFVITEFTDFDLSINNADSEIDEIYCLRNQKRASIRSNKNTINKINADLIYEISLLFWKQIKNREKKVKDILERMSSGKLIGVVE